MRACTGPESADGDAVSAAVRRPARALRVPRLTLTELELPLVRRVLMEPVRVYLTRPELARVRRGAAAVARLVARGEVVYGLNTGFGLLARTRIPRQQIGQLQR